MQLNNAGVIAVGNKADVLTVGLVGIDEPALISHTARFGLAHPAEREERVRKLVLRHRIEHVALIL